MGLAFDFPGQIVAGMFMAAGASAVGIAAGAPQGDEAGGQDGAFGSEGFWRASRERRMRVGCLGIFIGMEQ